VTKKGTRPGNSAADGARRRWAVDALVAAAVAAAQVGGTYALGRKLGTTVSPVGLALLAAGGVALAGRRRFPVAVLGITYATTLSYYFTSHGRGIVWLAVTVAFCTAIYLRKRAAALGCLGASYVAFLWGPQLAGGRGPSAVFALGLGTGLALLVGVAEVIRLGRQRALALEQRREEEALRRASEERLRIARDLHDVVAHNIAVINVQASTALHLMDRQPERARLALEAISEVSKQALIEIRSVLGVLRDVDEHPARAPSAGLGRLGELLENARSAGLSVSVERAGEQQPLPASVDLAAYRIVQESLTNSARHSPSTSVVLRLAYSGSDLLIEVDDSGTGRPGPHPVGSGNGIIGMTERARALGGTLKAAPRPTGGFRVQARLPTQAGSA
jgi:signal transduction histidine kinase